MFHLLFSPTAAPSCAAVAGPQRPLRCQRVTMQTSTQRHQSVTNQIVILSFLNIKSWLDWRFVSTGSVNMGTSPSQRQGIGSFALLEPRPNTSCWFNSSNKTDYQCHCATVTNEHCVCTRVCVCARTHALKQPGWLTGRVNDSSCDWILLHKAWTI